MTGAPKLGGRALKGWVSLNNRRLGWSTWIKYAIQWEYHGKNWDVYTQLKTYVYNMYVYVNIFIPTYINT